MKKIEVVICAVCLLVGIIAGSIGVYVYGTREVEIPSDEKMLEMHEHDDHRYCDIIEEYTETGDFGDCTQRDVKVCMVGHCIATQYRNYR